MAAANKGWLFVSIGVALAVVALALVFLVPWSEPCGVQAREASESWRDYARHLEAIGEDRAADARALEAEIRADPSEAILEAEMLMPDPNDETGSALYRDAMEQLALADTTCAQ